MRLDHKKNKNMSVRRNPFNTPSHHGSRISANQWLKRAELAVKLGKHVGTGMKRMLSAKKIKKSPSEAKQAVTELGERGTVHRESGYATRAPAAIKRKRKGVEYKTKKKLKVSKTFKAKVKQSLEPGYIHGSARIISLNHLELPVNGAQQVSEVVPNNRYSPWSFDAEWFLHLASVMFNGATFSFTNQGFQSAGNLGSTSASGAAPGLANYVNNAKLTIVNSYDEYLYKNNTPRTVHLDIYESAPKAAQVGTSAYKANVGVVSNPTGIYTPIELWQASLVQDIGSGNNLNGTNVLSLYETPTRTRAFNQVFKCNRIQVVLEPGQTYYHKVQGPSNMDLDYSNFFKNGVFMRIQKFMRHVMAVTRLDLVGHAGVADGGRFQIPSTKVDAGVGIYVECKQHCTIRMPEQTGFHENAITSGTKILGYRKPVYFTFTNMPGVGATGENYKIDEENPITATTA